MELYEKSLVTLELPAVLELLANEAVSEPARERGLDHLLRRIRSIAEIRVRVKVKCDHIIFSCLTLWSITWREASSRWISSGVMP